MLALVVLAFVMIALGAMGFALYRRKAVPSPSTTGEAHIRRREDARDWQVKLAADDTFVSNFHPPTQNEILETLHTLDHLSPRWDQGTGEIIEQRFMNEMAASFPSLQKPACLFPVMIIEDQQTITAANTEVDYDAIQLRIARQRDKFRQSRAQINALQQLAAGSAEAAAPVALPPGSLPFKARGSERAKAQDSWVPGVVGFSLIIACGLLCYWLYLKLKTPPPASQSILLSATNDFAPTPTMPSTSPRIDPASNLETQRESAIPSEMAATPQNGAIEAASPSPVADGSTAAALSTPYRASMSRSDMSSATRKASLDQQVAASKIRAVEKYPDLAVAASEINSRFVFRYKRMLQENSPRLQDPTWPEQLVEECAIAAGVAKPKSAPRTSTPLP